MITILSLVTSVKDYVEIAHKLIETDSNYSLQNYEELGPLFTYVLLSIKNFFYNIVSFNWLKTVWNLPIIIPDISSSMISEISVLDGYFHNTFNFLDTPISYGSNNGLVYSLEKFSIGLINSLFIWLPTSTAHIITLRRFVMQGLEAGYIAGLGTIAGSILWIGCIIFGCRFFVIPWISLDIFRYLLGFILLVKYMWDSYNERRMVLEDLSKQKIFLLNFLLALTEQTSIFPFLSNLSIGTETSIIESFPSDNYWQFLSIHGSYIIGLTLGSLSLLHFTCWFLENPAFKIYMWLISSFKVSSNVYYKTLNFTFLYLTMICSISSIPYYGLDYTLTNPLGFVSDDRIIDQKLVLETSFLNTKASDRNTRRNRGRHGRRERWKRRVRKYRTFDASLYDQGVYDLFSIEDLNYGFERFWLRRKMRNHRVRFRFFPGPWMRSFKKQLAKPRLESYSGPRQEFFRILFEQVYHPSFHEYKKMKVNFSKGDLNKKNSFAPLQLEKESSEFNKENLNSKEFLINSKILSNRISDEQPNDKLIEQNFTEKKRIVGLEHNIKNNLINENSMLRKFVRKVNTRVKRSEITSRMKGENKINEFKNQDLTNSIYSKRWKEIFSKLTHENEKASTNNPELKGLLKNFYKNGLTKTPKKSNINYSNENLNETSFKNENYNKKDSSKQNLSKKDKQILMYRSILINKNNLTTEQIRLKNEFNSQVLFHPIKFYLEKQQSFERKLRYYTPTVFRKFSIENNAPYFRGMMKRYFYYYKPNLRWENTMKTGSLRKARRKTIRTPRKIQQSEKQKTLISNRDRNGLDPRFVNSTSSRSLDDLAEQKNDSSLNNKLNSFSITNRLQKPTHNYSVVGKKASRYRYQIYKDVLQHWYYSPFNRLLLKLDVDSFIKRQPKTHFLTKKEENLLHLRRFLLSEHYNTLRWYSYMQHYRSMKTKIGGTKSFASRAYNQQFQGTFKKIRHLFAITPSQTICNPSLSSAGNECTAKDPIILKFDQPLYNQFENTTKNSFQNNLIIHEELLITNNNSVFATKNPTKNLLTESLFWPEDLLTQSTNVIREYIEKSRPIKQEYIKNLINEKNYSELTKFIFKGQKTRGTNPTTNDRGFISQEKDYLLSEQEKSHLNLLAKTRMQTFLKEKNLQQDLWVNLLKKWKRKINDQEFLKNYLVGRIEKREKRKQKKEKNFKNKLMKLDSWLSLQRSLSDKVNISSTIPLENKNNDLLKDKDIPINSGVKKAIFEGISNINELDLRTMNQREKLLWKSKIKNTLNTYNLKLSERDRDAAQLKTENHIRYSLNSLSDIIKKLNISNNGNILVKNKTILKKNSYAKLKSIYKNYKSKLSNFLNFKDSLIFLKAINKKSLKNWRKKERALNKQKRSRKEFKAFSKTQFKKSIDPNLVNGIKINILNNDLNQPLMLRKKRDFISGKNSINTNQEETFNLETFDNSKSFKDILENSKTSSSSSLPEKRSAKDLQLKKEIKPNFLSNFLTKQFKRKRSPHRRSRTRRNRGVTKKRTLSDSLKREFKNLLRSKKKYGGKLDNESKKLKIYGSLREKINNNLSAFDEQPKNNLQNIFSEKNPKQRRSKQKKQRSWKQKRSKYSQKLRKYKKRRRYALGKIRVLNKQLKRVKSKIQIQNWWWKQFLPSLQATTDSLWQIEKDRQIQEKLNELSKNNLLQTFTERDNISNLVLKSTPDSFEKEKTLQIGDHDFKPLAIPQALRLRENHSKSEKTSSASVSVLDKKVNLTNTTYDENLIKNKKENLVSKISENLLIPSNQNENKFKETIKESNYLLNTNTLPFYAGWDESLRKFIVTNRLLSRRDSGYQMNLDNFKTSGLSASNNSRNSSVPNLLENKEILLFNAAPLKGMNAATTLYWQIPFTTYDPDQFFALGMDGFAPLGWRRFQFRHTILKTWLYQSQSTLNKQKKPIIIKKKITIGNSKFNKLDQSLLYKIKSVTNQNNNVANQTTIINNKNASRRLKKRYKRVKKHPRSPVWFPSGPLLNQVLPVHYIYVFYKRTRLPRDRYLKRRLRSISQASNKINKGQINLLGQVGQTSKNINNLDFTLRKRIKTKRKYHIKRDSNKKTPILPRRLKFIGQDIDSLRWRPLSIRTLGLNFNTQNNQSIEEFIKEQLNTSRFISANKQSGSSRLKEKQPSNLRVKQLRRRVQRQIIRSVWRYRPRAGGFVWPGDYLKLESVKSPTLQTKVSFVEDKNIDQSIIKKPLIDSFSKNISQTRKIKRKKKRNISEWQIQPKKYLLQKHNIKVIKKKLEKAQRSNKIKQKIKELNLIL